MEIENRIRNLFWTISGDYTLDVKPDVEAFARSREIALPVSDPFPPSHDVHGNYSHLRGR